MRQIYQPWLPDGETSSPPRQRPLYRQIFNLAIHNAEFFDTAPPRRKHTHCFRSRFQSTILTDRSFNQWHNGLCREPAFDARDCLVGAVRVLGI
jgi:hypothetical protein